MPCETYTHPVPLLSYFSLLSFLSPFLLLAPTSLVLSSSSSSETDGGWERKWDRDQERSKGELRERWKQRGDREIKEGEIEIERERDEDPEPEGRRPDSRPIFWWVS